LVAAAAADDDDDDDEGRNILLFFLHKSQVGEVLSVQVTLSVRRVWARSLKRATLRHEEDQEACIYW